MSKESFNFLKALTSFEVLPVGSYETFLPKNDIATRIGSYWLNTENYLTQAIQSYEAEKVVTNEETRSYRANS